MGVDLQIRAPDPRETTGQNLALGLLQRFDVRTDGEPIWLPLVAQRLIAFLALHDRPQSRMHVAGVLWPEADDHHASANLRSTLWRISRIGPPLLSSVDGSLRLRLDISVDVRDAYSLARRLLEPASAPCDPTLESTTSLREDVLPDWYEDWVVIERERFRQIRLHALEALCYRFADAGLMAQAIEAGLAAVASEPLRESAHRALITVHLREGNRVEALRQFTACKIILRDELGVEPSPELSEVLETKD
jgi:DNA-binding SARP family transcriptional activator